MRDFIVIVWAVLVMVMYLTEREERNELKLEDNFFYSLITSMCYASNKNCFSRLLKFLDECSSK